MRMSFFRSSSSSGNIIWARLFGKWGEKGLYIHQKEGGSPAGRGMPFQGGGSGNCFFLVGKEGVVEKKILFFWAF